MLMKTGNTGWRKKHKNQNIFKMKKNKLLIQIPLNKQITIYYCILKCIHDRYNIT